MLLLLVDLKPAFYLSAILTIFSDKLSYTVVAEVHKRKPSLLSLVFITKNTELEEDEMIRLACLIGTTYIVKVIKVCLFLSFKTLWSTFRIHFF